MTNNFSHHKEILIICPTRGRYENAIRLIRSWRETTSNRSDLVFVVDDDDEAGKLLWQKQADMGVKVHLGLRMNYPTKANLVVHDNPNRKLYMSVDDDQIFRTAGWEDRYLDIVASHKYAVIWANDLHNKEKSPSGFAVTNALVRCLKWFAYPRVDNLEVDRVLGDISQALGIAFYLDDVIIEHMHPVLGKSEIDQTYQEHWASAETDRLIRKEYWEKHELPVLVARLRELL